MRIVITTDYRLKCRRTNFYRPFGNYDISTSQKYLIVKKHHLNMVDITFFVLESIHIRPRHTTWSQKTHNGEFINFNFSLALKQWCGSGMFIPDLNFFHPCSRIPDPHQRILTPKIVSKLSEIWSRLFILDPDPDILPIPDPGSRGQTQTAPDPDPQHCFTVYNATGHT